jgi:Gly-Xaa carboxypeptidase
MLEKEPPSPQLPSPATAELLGHSKEDRPASGLLRRGNSNLLRCVLVAVAFLVTSATYYGIFKSPPWARCAGRSSPSPAEACAQYEPLAPPPNDALDAQLVHLASSPHFRNQTAQLLSGAVQVRSESFDDLGEVGEDARWDVFANVHAYLERSFPNVHKTLDKENVNKFGLLYTWKGKDESLKPLLLMAHQVRLAVDLRPLWPHF